MESETPLTAAELRERRRQRILGNSENRMNRILSGPNGDENRTAPAMEGGEAFSFVPPQNVDNTQTFKDNAELKDKKESFAVSLRRKKEIISLVFGTRAW
ncbi:unnamed protein product [Auanema sp. JU1783]|nr:unnamed protein product [Auanema sp. JU1783]